MVESASQTVSTLVEIMSRPLLALVFVGAASALKHSFLTQHAPHHAVRAALLMAEPKLMVHVE
jgi:hypothetical protein